MNKNLIIKIVVGLLVLVVMVVLFLITRPGEEPATVYIIESDDGTAKLEIPKDALPEGISLEDISITKRVGEMPSGVYARYELAPDGLEFRNPVTVAATMTVPDNIPIAFFESEDSVEILPALEISVQNDTATVIVRLQHFSSLTFAESPFGITISPDKINSNVDEKFYISIRPWRNFDDITLTEEKVKYGFWGDASFYGSWTHQGGILKPKLRGISKKLGRWESLGPWLPRDFTCIKVGKGTLIYDGKITSMATTEILRNGEWVKPRQTYVALTQKYYVSVNCLAPGEKKEQGVIGQPKDTEQKKPEGPFTISIKPTNVRRKVNEKFNIDFAMGVKAEEAYDADFGNKNPLLGKIESIPVTVRTVYSPPTSISASWHERDLGDGRILKPTEPVRIEDSKIEDFHFHSVEYTCVKTGKSELVLEADISVAAEEYYLYQGEDEWWSGGPFGFSKSYDDRVPVECIEAEKDQGVIGQPDDAAQPAPEPEPEPEPEPKPDDPNEARCTLVCGKDRYFPAASLNECSDTSEVFLCIQNKQACYNYLIPRGWQIDSNCCCQDSPIESYAGGRVNCSKFTGWGINGYAVDKSPYYPFGQSTKSAAECK